MSHYLCIYLFSEYLLIDWILFSRLSLTPPPPFFQMELSFININEHAHYEFPAVYENKTKCGDRRKCQYTYLRRHSSWVCVNWYNNAINEKLQEKLIALFLYFLQKDVNYGKWWFVFHRYTRRRQCWTFQSSPSNEVCGNEEVVGLRASGSDKAAGSRGTEASTF